MRVRFKSIDSYVVDRTTKSWSPSEPGDLFIYQGIGTVSFVWFRYSKTSDRWDKVPSTDVPEEFRLIIKLLV